MQQCRFEFLFCSVKKRLLFFLGFFRIDTLLTRSFIMNAGFSGMQPGQVRVTHANNDRNKQIYMVAEQVWGLKADKLSQARFDEIRAVRDYGLEKKYGPVTVQAIEGTLMVFLDRDAIGKSRSPCSLDTCMVNTAALRCARCRSAIYCCKDHQRADWGRHKIECVQSGAR